jgi:hypothetical protein
MNGRTAREHVIDIGIAIQTEELLRLARAQPQKRWRPIESHLLKALECTPPGQVTNG